ncbi:M20 aminoacylase family protein [Rubellimicrobium roseum]|uniref:Amidohydrolase n=1 Tax=Rubellimicrobium roseum TaxID=687525 RepID=A0A5C4NC30_9RHOB|nr:M20 aminoacylase family protein [Rubellimicrobium roseum]TNC71435.1 amidohydrolase [Rubellimicrobium roseum]
MPVVNRISAFADDMAAWRHHIHRRPELGFDLPETAAFVAARLREFGVDEIHEGIATSGIVALIHGRAKGPAIGLRADMDALPMEDLSGAPYASEIPGRAHACGHDGHTAMLLGAARYLAETRNFAGTAVLLFQPAEEQGGGGQVMVQEGVLDRFAVQQVYAMHIAPGTPLGEFATTPGPIMAAVDDFSITLRGRGGHAAYPHDATDPIPGACALVGALQTIASRNADPMKQLVVSVTQVHAGSAYNVIPEEAMVSGTIRSYDKALHALARRRLEEIVHGHAAAFDLGAQIDIIEGYPPTVNDPDRTAFAAEVAREVAGRVDTAMVPEMGAEDFSFMLEARPGAFLFLGNGDTPMCHHPAFDFDDRALPVGASTFARLIERALPLTE